MHETAIEKNLKDNEVDSLDCTMYVQAPDL